jgi:hypothetical protein
MDKNFLEFWGQFFMNAAQGQQQLENWNKWFTQSMGGENPFLKTMSMFKPQEIEKPKEAAPEIFEMTKKATDAYKEVFKATLSMFDMISKEDYTKLLNENEQLKEKIAQQQEMIQNVKKQSNNDSFDQEDVVSNLTEIVTNQTKQFQELMNQIGKYYKKDSSKK